MKSSSSEIVLITLVDLFAQLVFVLLVALGASQFIHKKRIKELTEITGRRDLLSDREKEMLSLSGGLGEAEKQFIREYLDAKKLDSSIGSLQDYAKKRVVGVPVCNPSTGMASQVTMPALSLLIGDRSVRVLKFTSGLNPEIKKKLGNDIIEDWIPFRTFGVIGGVFLSAANQCRFFAEIAYCTSDAGSFNEGHRTIGRYFHLSRNPKQLAGVECDEM